MMSVLSHSDTELGPSLGSPLSPIKSPKAAEPGLCQPGSVAELGLKLYLVNLHVALLILKNEFSICSLHLAEDDNIKWLAKVGQVRNEAERENLMRD